MGDALSFLVIPFAASVAFVLIHTYLGVHVLRRKIVFADLALAQLSALGATVAFANGYSTTSTAGLAYAVLFTAMGALLLTATRGLARYVSREAFVGLLYVVATAATILVVDRSPQGAEHVKKILVGSLLTVDAADVARFSALYAIIGLLHWILRRPLLVVSTDASPAGPTPFAIWVCDLFFFASFGVVVASSVSVAGVLLVFSFLIVPALVGSIFSAKMHIVLLIGCGVGVVASAVGLAGSYVFDLPTGAAMVTALALFLLLAGLARALVFVGRRRRRANLSIAAYVVATLALSLTLVSSLWLMINPTADQPLFAILESASGFGPVHFLESRERATFESAAQDTVRFQAEVDRLNAMEKQARYRGAPLSDDEVRRIASYQQSFNEMTRGERFVQDVLQGRGRARERWIVGAPAAILALAGLGVVTFSARRRHGLE